MAAVILQRGGFLYRHSLPAFGGDRSHPFPGSRSDIRPAGVAYPAGSLGVRNLLRSREAAVNLMSAGEWIAIISGISGAIVAIIGVIISGLTARSAARKDEISSLRDAIAILQVENERMQKRIQSLEIEIQEREQRILFLETSLREQTQARAEREETIHKMEVEIMTLQDQVRTLQNKESAATDEILSD